MADEERRRQEGHDRRGQGEGGPPGLHSGRRRGRCCSRENAARPGRRPPRPTVTRSLCPGREQEYEAYKALESGIQEAGGPGLRAPAHRRGAQEPLPGDFSITSTMYPRTTSRGRTDLAEPLPHPVFPQASPPVSKSSAPVEYGAESPMPGREHEYETFKAQGGARGSGGGLHLRRRPSTRSAGTAPRDFSITSMMCLRTTSRGRTDLAEPAAAPPAPEEGAPAAYGAESPMPGREHEYEANNSQGGGQWAARGLHLRRRPSTRSAGNRSPGLQHNFYDVPTSDFKRPYGMSPGAPGTPCT